MAIVAQNYFLSVTEALIRKIPKIVVRKLMDAFKTNLEEELNKQLIKSGPAALRLRNVIVTTGDDAEPPKQVL